MSESRASIVLNELRNSGLEDIIWYDVKDADEDECRYRDTYWNVVKNELESRRAAIELKPWEKMSSWEKLCCYKISGKAGVDCDVALRSMVIFYLAFGLDAGDLMDWSISPQRKKPMQHQLTNENQEWTLRGDTMNSYGTTVHEYIQTVLGKRNSESRAQMREKGIIENARTKGGKILAKEKYCKGKNQTAHWERAILDQYDAFFKQQFPHSAHAFLQLYHTVGNFIPAPFEGRGMGEFNGPRGFAPSKDYWDLALLCIYYHYLDYPKEKMEAYTLEWLLRERKKRAGDQNNAALCRKWLGMFGSWDNFVERNFLQDFVNRQGCGYGSPKELWHGHFDKGIMPKEETDFDQFFTNASAWIAARGMRIAVAVKKRLENNDINRLIENMQKGS